MLKHIAILLSLFLPLPAISQIFEYAVPEKLPSAVNTDEEESSPLLSMDGSKLFFTRLLCPENIGGKYTGSDIWSIDHIGTTWGTADNIKINLNNKNNNAVIGMSTAGDVLYLMDASSTSKINGIYISKRVNEMWTKSELIPLSGIESDGFVSFYASPELDVLFVSMNGKDSKGEEDLYVCIKEDSAVWSKPKNLGSTINTSGFEISPFLSADKRRLYFSSNGHPGLGDADIFYSDRLYDSWETWSIPKNLGTNINSTNFDAYFSQYGDSVAYFTSNRQSELSNIFKSKVASASYALMPGQRFLEDKEVKDIIGKDVATSIAFDGGSFEITATQQELLFYISNKIIEYDNISILFVCNNNEMATLRIANLMDYFISNGLDRKRILSSQLKGFMTKESQNLVRLRFITQ